MIAYSTLVGTVSRELPSIPSVSVIEMLAKVARDFFKATLAWEETVTITTAVGTDNYSLPTSIDSIPVEIVRVREVFRENARIHELPFEQISYLKQVNTNHSTPTKFHRNREQILFYPTPDKVMNITLVLSVMPTKQATELQDFHLQRYEDALINGTLYRLMLQPKKPWSNPELARYYRQQYLNDVEEVNGEVMTARGARKVRFNSFA